MTTDTALPPTPDYDAWPIEARLQAVESSPRQVSVRWSDGRVSRYHSIWLRENAADDTTVNPATRERILDLSTLPAWPEIANAEIDGSGALCIDFVPEERRLRFHPGWLRAHDYDNAADDEAPLVPVTTWRGGPGERPDSLDASGLLDSEPGDDAEEAILAPALEAILGKGLARLRNLPTEPGSLEAIARRIGPVRPTNFGQLFDVRAKPEPDSNAYTSIALPPHVDLPTREYHPGLQCLHCLENSVAGGEAVMLDGFAVAEALRERDPQAYATLTRVRWRFANTARTTDHVWHAPMIRLDARGELLEVRIADFLRGPLQTDFAEVEPAYEALMALQRLLREPEFAIRFTYQPGDLVIFDNRRLLHARDAFEGDSGHRWLQGCYLERDEIRSRYRMIQRARRQRRIGAEER
ncbi:TauD/TfdA family dioxygenase [Halomonas elongata]|uniref:Gamma-butyrobetaine dioxygenase n=1 Tax=Halomonas elongata (strain ATCC 33173 / DSM 2581 / NBRC 15536 / NCIMB 2198 / 1H9) TaxID=768066 RepID=E1V3G2_HALED|nr:TauD/TfdA family dioxygenase [Halomonas elongata]WBF16366.1 TauD/TfdA family dioxygenase [Halomonas elongata]WPU48806.1 TauD/TfdA family dioxygenase [Halomonas elongata DSM 2581]CBV42641.2 gamma-butyrobetaine dioxygenase [Halomonas elongata DSM 2581]